MFEVSVGNGLCFGDMFERILRFDSWNSSVGRFKTFLVDDRSNSCGITSGYLLEILLCYSSTFERWTSARKR